MTAPFDIITFDCYGTLIDWERGIRHAFLRAAAEEGMRIAEGRIIAAFAAVEPVVEREGYRLYREVLAETARRAAWSLGWHLTPEQAGFLAASLPSWPPFDDTDAALERLQGAGISLGILSNVDEDLLAATRRHFRAGFEIVVTAEQVRSYKPAPAHFLAARERIGRRRWLHAAQSNFHDIVPANALGIPTAWINRKGEAPLAGGEPSLHVRTLSELADRLAP
ncbi:MAG TPA: HAD-IA family hydrolase [Thermoanaerobaculia bacterium]|nr:HAD-IA family hydrolase [Thermoanaerobaculia bacterium]